MGFGEIAEDGAGGFLVATLPTGAGAGLFGLFGALETFVVELDAGIASGVDHKVEGEAEGLVEVKGLLPVKGGMRSVSHYYEFGQKLRPPLFPKYLYRGLCHLLFAMAENEAL